MTNSSTATNQVTDDLGRTVVASATISLPARMFCRPPLSTEPSRSIIFNEINQLYLPVGTNVSSGNPSTGTTVKFQNVSQPGSINFTTSAQQPNPTTGFNFLNQYFAINTQASYSGTITITQKYNEADVIAAGLTEPQLRLYHWNSSSSVWDGVTMSVDTVNNMIIGQVNSLSWFAIGAKANKAPVIGTFTLPMDPIQKGIAVNASASFTDLDTSDTHTGIYEWGDGTTSAAFITETNGSGTATGSHSYNQPGVYEVKLTITDRYGAQTAASFQYVVVYDPSGGFITGEGWINSPAGASVANSTLTGKAIFGFVSKYQKSATTPTGNTEFDFKVGNLNFHSDSYDWLVIAGAKAQYKGVGKINGTGNYGFMLSAIDGQLLGKNKADMFRIKIWNKAANDVVVYDNQLGADENDDPTTAIAGGNIVIHKE